MFKSGHLVTIFLVVLLCIAGQQVVSAENVQLKGEDNTQVEFDRKAFKLKLDLSSVGNYYTDTLGKKFELKVGGCTIPFETTQCDSSTYGPNHLTIPGAAPTGQDYFHKNVVTFFVDDSKIVSDLAYSIAPSTDKQFEVKCKVQFNENLVSEKYVVDVSLTGDVPNEMVLTIDDYIAATITLPASSSSITSTTVSPIASTKASANNQNKGFPLWAIILIVVAAVFIVLFIILCVVGFCILRSRKLKKQNQDKKKQSDFTEMTVTTVNETTQEAFKDKTEVTKSSYGAGPTQKVKVIDSSQMGQVAPPVIASIAPIHAKPASAKEKMPAKEKVPVKKEKKSAEKPDKSVMPAKEKTQHTPFVAPNLIKATVPGVDLN